MSFRRFLILTLALLAFSACKSEFIAIMENGDTDLKYKAAMDYFELGKYSKSVQLFESLSLALAGSQQEDTVLYYWGLSNYRFKDYVSAEANFDKYLESYPRGAFSEEARFFRIDCLYRSTLRYELDQTPTYKAITAISEYVLDYPDNQYMKYCSLMLDDLEERLDRKAYEAARLYYKMEDYQAARVSLKNILKEDSENRYREDILYYTAMSSYKYAFMSVASRQKDRYLSFVDDYLNFAGEYPESKYKKELDSLYDKAQKALGR